jgi:hypothetical protein
MNTRYFLPEILRLLRQYPVQLFPYIARQPVNQSELLLQSRQVLDLGKFPDLDQSRPGSKKIRISEIPEISLSF